MKQADTLILQPTEDDEEDMELLMLDLFYHRTLSQQLKEEAIPSTDACRKEMYRSMENLGLAYGADILVNRTRVALDPLAKGAAALERETRELANKIVQMSEQLLSSATRGDLLISRAMQVAAMADQTHELFVAAIAGDPACIDAQTNRVAPAVWGHMCELVGRRGTLSPPTKPT